MNTLRGEEPLCDEEYDCGDGTMVRLVRDGLWHVVSANDDVREVLGSFTGIVDARTAYWQAILRQMAHSVMRGHAEVVIDARIGLARIVVLRARNGAHLLELDGPLGSFAVRRAHHDQIISIWRERCTENAHHCANSNRAE